jgi:hypothetical protein
MTRWWTTWPRKIGPVVFHVRREPSLFRRKAPFRVATSSTSCPVDGLDDRGAGEVRFCMAVSFLQGSTGT